MENKEVKDKNIINSSNNLKQWCPPEITELNIIALTEAGYGQDSDGTGFATFS